MSNNEKDNRDKKTVEIVISQGRARAIYCDELLPYARAMRGDIQRASFVEPDNCRGWYVDLSFLGGSVVRGFRTRRQALQYERIWLKRWLRRGAKSKYLDSCLRTATATSPPSRLRRWLSAPVVCVRCVLSFLVFVISLVLFVLSGGNASWLADE